MDKSIGRWIKIGVALAALAALALFLYSIGGLVKLLIVSALLAYVIDPVASLLESRGLSRTAATSVIFLFIILAAAVFLFLFLPALSDQVESIQEGLGSGQADVLIAKIETVVKSKLSFLGLRDFNLLDRVHAETVNALNWVFNHMSDVVSLVTDMVIIPFVVFFLLKDGRDIKKQFVGMVPNRYFEFTLNLLYKMDVQLGNYLRGQFLDALIIGVLSTIALWILNVKYFFVFGAFAGLANLIPYLGPVAGAALAIVVTIFDTGSTAAAPSIALAFVLVKLLDDTLIQPLIVAKSVDMHPLLVLLAVIIGGKFFGILGMLLSVPFTGFMSVAVKESIAIFRKYG
ncbi:MAG TPA: AI-2E family transporter [Dissulfurispiraceae bacterium]